MKFVLKTIVILVVLFFLSRIAYRELNQRLLTEATETAEVETAKADFLWNDRVRIYNNLWAAYPQNRDAFNEMFNTEGFPLNTIENKGQ